MEWEADPLYSTFTHSQPLLSLKRFTECLWFALGLYWLVRSGLDVASALSSVSSLRAIAGEQASTTSQ